VLPQWPQFRAMNPAQKIVRLLLPFVNPIACS
jgi:hypothetical protein